MQKKFEINPTKVKGSFYSGRKVVTHDSKSDLPLVTYIYFQNGCFYVVVVFSAKVLSHVEQMTS